MPSNPDCSDDYSIRQSACGGQNGCWQAVWKHLAVKQGNCDRPAARRGRREWKARGNAAVVDSGLSRIGDNAFPGSHSLRFLLSAEQQHAPPRVALLLFARLIATLPNRVGDRLPSQPVLSLALCLATHGCILAALLAVRFVLGGLCHLRDFSPCPLGLVPPYNWGTPRVHRRSIVLLSLLAFPSQSLSSSFSSFFLALRHGCEGLRRGEEGRRCGAPERLCL